MNRDDLDEFTRSYIGTMLWSSTCDPYGKCSDCGKENQVLCRWNEDDEYVCMNCSERQPNYEPPADENYDIENISPEFMKDIVEECADFQKRFGNLIVEHPRVSHEGSSNLQMAGHDYWLTRNHHGAGFWDSDWEKEFGEELTKASHADGEVNLYVGDNGKLYGE